MYGTAPSSLPGALLAAKELRPTLRQALALTLRTQHNMQVSSKESNVRGRILPFLFLKEKLFDLYGILIEASINLALYSAFATNNGACLLFVLLLWSLAWL